MGEVIQFVPRTVPKPKDPAEVFFDVADHLHLVGQVLDYSGLTDPGLPSDVGFHPSDSDPA